MTSALPAHSKAIRLSAAALAAVLAALILHFSLIPAEDAPGVDIYDKLKHFLAYTALSLPVTICLGPQRMLASILAVTLYGVGLEVAQGLATAHREPSGGDALANGLGATLGACLAWISCRIAARR